MKLTFVGTSHGIPQADRYCSCYMIEAGDGVYFVDAGRSPADAMRDFGVDSKKLRAVFTTHQHGDHTGGLIPAIATLAWRQPGIKFKVFLTAEELAQAYRKYFAATFPSSLGTKLFEDIELSKASCGEIYRDENISVTYHETQHLKGLNKASYGIVIKELCDTGASVLFSGDLSFKLGYNDFPTEQAGEAHELFVCEMAHFYPEHVEEHLTKAGVKNLVITHLNRNEEKIPLIEAMAQRLPYPVWLASDGDVLELTKGEVKRI